MSRRAMPVALRRFDEDATGALLGAPAASADQRRAAVAEADLIWRTRPDVPLTEALVRLWAAAATGDLGARTAALVQEVADDGRVSRRRPPRDVVGRVALLAAVSVCLLSSSSVAFVSTARRSSNPVLEMPAAADTSATVALVGVALWLVLLLVPRRWTGSSRGVTGAVFWVSVPFLLGGAALAWRRIDREPAGTDPAVTRYAVAGVLLLVCAVVVVVRTVRDVRARRRRTVPAGTSSLDAAWSHWHARLRETVGDDRSADAAVVAGVRRLLGLRVLDPGRATQALHVVRRRP